MNPPIPMVQWLAREREDAIRHDVRRQEQVAARRRGQWVAVIPRATWARRRQPAG